MARAALIVFIIAVVLYSCAADPPCKDPNQHYSGCVGCAHPCGLLRPPPCNIRCRPGCKCKPDYYVNRNRQCVRWEDC